VKVLGRKAGQRQMAKADLRFEIRDLRFEIRDSRSQIRDSRPQIRDSRSRSGRSADSVLYFCFLNFAFWLLIFFSPCPPPSAFLLLVRASFLLVLGMLSVFMGRRHGAADKLWKSEIRKQKSEPRPPCFSDFYFLISDFRSLSLAGAGRSADDSQLTTDNPTTGRLWDGFAANGCAAPRVIDRARITVGHQT